MEKYQISNIKYQNYPECSNFLRDGSGSRNYTSQNNNIRDIPKFKNFSRQLFNDRRNPASRYNGIPSSTVKAGKFCKVTLIFTFCILNFLGCATYKYQLGKKPYDKGYVVSRDNYAILEYTLGGDNSLPDDLGLAKERFQRRHKIVEHYYKKMGYIENRFKMAFWNPCIYTFKTMRGLFRLPFVAISDYRYEHNPKYRERIIKIEEEKELRQEAYIQGLKDKLNGYIQQDTALEDQTQGLRTAKEIRPAPEVVAETLARIEKKVAEKKPKPLLKKNRDISASSKKELSSQPVAIIIAKPTKGFSPLRVRFYGYKSYVKGAKIVSYDWNFGDGDTSAQINPTNIYYSGSFQPQYLDVTLTVRDDKGNTAQATTTVEVLNK